jgi:hypothetical protein
VVLAEVAMPPSASELPPPTVAPAQPLRVSGVREPLAITGTEIGTMTLVGAGAIATGLGLQRAGHRQQEKAALEPEP